MQSDSQPAAPPVSAGRPQPGVWEYKVVHINVESGPAPQPPDPKTASDHLHGTLSPRFLQREFPEHYGEQSEAAKRNRHPAEQLQSFLNLLGKEGWELTTTSQVGQLLMFFFKRPLRPAPKLIASAEIRRATASPAATPPAQTSPPESSPSPPSPSSPSGSEPAPGGS